MSNSLKHWLESQKKELLDRIRQSRRYANYVDEIICNTDDFYIWKKGGLDTVRKEGNATIIELAPLQAKLVSPVPIRLKLNGDWRSWYEGKAYMGVLLGGICRHVAVGEERIVADTLMRDAKAFDVRSEAFTLDGFKEAISFINSQGNFADILLVNPMQLTKLRKDNNFIPYWNLGQKFLDEKGVGFIGLLSHLSVYETVGLLESTALIYEKREIKVRKTPLSIKFDNYDNPETLTILEDMLAWTMENWAIAKISLKT